MLECVVEHNQIDTRIEFEQLVYPGAAVLAYGDSHVAPEILVNLIWFVADIKRRGAVCGEHEAFCVALVAARNHADAVFVAQQVEDVFGMWSLARTSGRNIAYHNHGHRKFTLLEDMPLEHKIAHRHPETI